MVKQEKFNEISEAYQYVMSNQNNKDNLIDPSMLFSQLFQNNDLYFSNMNMINKNCNVTMNSTTIRIVNGKKIETTTYINNGKKYCLIIFKFIR